MNTGRIKTGFDIATGLLVVGAVAFWIIEPPLPAANAAGHRTAASVSAQTQSPAAAAPDRSDASAIVSGNIFSATRAAPVARYTPAGSGNEAMAEPPALTEFVPPVVPPRVYGTMSGPAGATALIQSDSAGSSGRLYREGERVGQFRIERILGSSVILRGPSGRVEITVERREERIQ